MTRHIDSLTYGDRMTLEYFRKSVESGCFNDDDGHFSAFDKDGNEVMQDKPFWGWSPSSIAALPASVTQVVWFNK